MKLVTVQKASELTKLSVIDLKLLVQAGSLPAITAKSGKILFDIDAVMRVLKADKNPQSEHDPEPVVDYDPTFSIEGCEVTMANAHLLFSAITQDDVAQGRFGADTLALNPLDTPTSETLKAHK